MDQHATAVTLEPSLVRFAQQLRHDLDAQRVLLFGSRARGQGHADSDYDLIIVSPRFAGIEPPRRAIGLRDLWYRAGGRGPMDLLCVTPEEFLAAQQRISLIAAVLPEAIDLLTAEPSPPRLPSMSRG